MDRGYETKWEIMTPEVTRPPPMSGRPGEGTIAARRPKSPAPPPKSKWSLFASALARVPWGALLACSFLLTGLAIFMMHGKKAAEPSQEILDLVQSASAGFPHYVHVFNGSYAVTAGLAAGCLAASAVLAIIRFNQKALKRESTGEWSKATYLSLRTLGVLALVSIVVPSVWFLLNVIFLAGWGVGLRTLRDGAMAAGVNMIRWTTDSAAADAMQVVLATDMVCPSAGCLNMSYYAWLESAACLCSQQLLVALQGAARTALTHNTWTLGGMGCLLVGSLIAAAQGAADVAMLGADWQLIAMKRRSQASPSRRPKPAGFDKYGGTPGSALPKLAIYGPGFAARTPQASYVE